MEYGENESEPPRQEKCLTVSQTFSTAYRRGFLYNKIFRALGDKITGKAPEARHLEPDCRGL